MATYGDMQDRIAEEMHREDDTAFATHIQRAILSAVQFYSPSRFSGNEKRGTITTIDGTRFCATDTASPGTLPTDIAEIDTVVLTTSGRDYLVERVSNEYLDEVDGGATLTVGDPTKWAWYSGQLRLYPTPNAARVVTLSYQTILTALSADADTNFWTTEAEFLIRARAKKDLALHVTFDAELASAMAVEEREALSQLKKQTYKLESSGRLRSTTF